MYGFSDAFGIIENVWRISLLVAMPHRSNTGTLEINEHVAMNLSITVDPALGNDWYSKTERQVEMDLGSMDSLLRELSVLLTSLNNPVSDGKGRASKKTIDAMTAGDEGRTELVKCTVAATLHNGGAVSYTTSSSDPRVCLLDALARMRRQLLREVSPDRFSQTASDENAQSAQAQQGV